MRATEANRMIALNVSTFIRKRRLTIGELADMAAVSPYIINRMRKCNNGRFHHFKPGTIEAVASAVGVTADVLVNDIADAVQREEIVSHIISLHDGGTSDEEIADKLDLNDWFVMNVISEMQGKEKPTQFVTGSYKLTKEQLTAAARMREEGQTYREIAESFGVCPETIKNHLMDAGVRKGTAARGKIVRLYSSGYSVKRIAEKTGAGTGVIRNVIRKARNDGRAAQRTHSRSYKLADDQIAQVVRMYESGCSASQIAKVFGVTSATIRNYVRMVKAKQADDQQ